MRPRIGIKRLTRAIEAEVRGMRLSASRANIS
jgi:hypothetical protein